MSQREHERHPRTTNEQPPSQPNATLLCVRPVQIAIVAAAAIGLALSIWWPRPSKPVSSSRSSPDSSTLADLAHPDPSSSTLLQQMAPTKPPEEADLSGPVATTEQLEKQFSTISENQHRVNDLKAHASRAAAARDIEIVKQDVEEGKPLVSLLNLRLAAFERDLAAARRARPQDGTVQWLTGELFIIVGGEPEEILPYLNRAAAAGLKRPQLFASLAKVEFDLNHFQAAYDYAVKAIEQDTRDRAEWEIYSRASFGLERFGEVIQRLDQAFPKSSPEWTGAIRRDAQRLLTSWLREVAFRRAEDRAGDLPLVRLVVEHRKFLGPTEVKTTGRGEAVIELFEDQAPATVANFIHLVEAGFYNGTSFHWAEAGHLVAGGDPNTKNDNPGDDGTGGPGYTIPDEFASPGARGHFRGSISTLQRGPGTAGSQFFIALVPSPEFDGRSTAFGRVIQGQDVLDQVTEGRTNREVGQFGKIIPGDRVVRAEVIRKRPH